MAVTINGDGLIQVDGTSTTQGRVRLNEDTDNGTNYVELQAPANLAANLTLTMPAADGTNGQYLQTNGSGVLSFSTVAGGVTSLNGQTGAITNTDLDAIGSYGIFIVATNTNVGLNATIAGSNLRYNPTYNALVDTNIGYNLYLPCRRRGLATYDGGGTALSGTWRKMDSGVTYNTDGSQFFWQNALFVRIS